MIKIEINEQELKNYVSELIASDEDIVADSKTINKHVSEFLARLAESPEELLAEIITDYIYVESQE